MTKHSFQSLCGFWPGVQQGGLGPFFLCCVLAGVLTHSNSPGTYTPSCSWRPLSKAATAGNCPTIFCAFCCAKGTWEWPLPRGDGLVEEGGLWELGWREKPWTWTKGQMWFTVVKYLNACHERRLRFYQSALWWGFSAVFTWHPGWGGGCLGRRNYLREIGK